VLFPTHTYINMPGLWDCLPCPLPVHLQSITDILKITAINKIKDKIYEIFISHQTINWSFCQQFIIKFL
jgi:hypothetical protein